MRGWSFKRGFIAICRYSGFPHSGSCLFASGVRNRVGMKKKNEKKGEMMKLTNQASPEHLLTPPNCTHFNPSRKSTHRLPKQQSVTEQLYKKICTMIMYIWSMSVQNLIFDKTFLYADTRSCMDVDKSIISPQFLQLFFFLLFFFS